MSIDLKLMLSFEGNFTFDTVNNILKEAKTVLPSISDKKAIQKKIYSISVEAVENIFKHYNISEEDSKNFSQYPCIFKLSQGKNEIYIITGNLIYNKDIDPLKEKIDFVNNLSGEELKNWYLKRVAENELSEKGTAGIGLIKIARDSENKLKYEFQPINEYLSFYTLTVKIDLKEIGEVKPSEQ